MTVPVVVGFDLDMTLVDARAGIAATYRVGDHVADVRAAQAAGATAVGVATGPCSEAELAAAGADAVLADLREFGELASRTGSGRGWFAAPGAAPLAHGDVAAGSG